MTAREQGTAKAPALPRYPRPRCPNEAKTLNAIGGERLAGAFLRAYAAAEPFEILSPEAALVVRVGTRGRLVEIKDAPGLVAKLTVAKQGEPEIPIARGAEKGSWCAEAST